MMCEAIGSTHGMPEAVALALHRQLGDAPHAVRLALTVVVSLGLLLAVWKVTRWLWAPSTRSDGSPSEAPPVG